MRDGRGDMAPAAGILLALAVSVGGVAAIWIGVQIGPVVLDYMAWAIVTLAEAAR